MLKKSMKIVSVLLVAIMLVLMFSNTVSALTLNWDDPSTAINKATVADTGAQNSVANIAKSVIQIVQIVGMAVAVIMLVVLAIKYISAAPSDKADIKKHAVVYVVGAIVLFAASGLLEIIKNFTKNIQP